MTDAQRNHLLKNLCRSGNELCQFSVSDFQEHFETSGKYLYAELELWKNGKGITTPFLGCFGPISRTVLQRFHHYRSSQESINQSHFLSWHQKIKLKFKLGLSNHKEEIKPLEHLGPAIRTTLLTEEIESDWDNVESINLSLT